MAQFDVYRLANGSLVVDCQADSLSYLSTRTVAPLMRRADVPVPMTRLHPVLAFADEPFLLATHLLTAMPYRELGSPVASLAHEEYIIKNALDMLLSGV